MFFCLSENIFGHPRQPQSGRLLLTTFFFAFKNQNHASARDTSICSRQLLAYPRQLFQVRMSDIFLARMAISTDAMSVVETMDPQQARIAARSSIGLRAQLPVLATRNIDRDKLSRTRDAAQACTDVISGPALVAAHFTPGARRAALDVIWAVRLWDLARISSSRTSLISGRRASRTRWAGCL